jgi:hypothetical protein
LRWLPIDRKATARVVGLVGFLLLTPIAAHAAARIWRASHSSTEDRRVVRDRLHLASKGNQEDFSFLNAVGAVWPADIGNSAVGYSASTAFLIDRCHVLTNMHAVYTGDLVVNPPVGKSVVFGVGQTAGERNKGALQGLRYLMEGETVAHGDAIVVDQLVHNPENDWALIRLGANVNGSIVPLRIAAVGIEQVSKGRRLSIAGFPVDRRLQRGDQLELKDLWGSEGEVVRVVRSSTIGAVLETTIQATRGNSGGPLYGDFNGQKHIVIGMHQGIRGNGIDVSESAPNVQIFFTSGTLASIRTAQAATPCNEASTVAE